MRIIVMFDLPMQTKEEKRAYQELRSYLLKNGYIMIQYSIYSRFCRHTSDLNKHIERIKKVKPKYGDVRIIQVTEIQYNNMLFLVGDYNNNEKTVNSDPLIIIE